MTFEQDYNNLIRYAEKFIWQKKLRIDAADLVNDAFIKHTESGREYFIGDIKSLIIGGSFKEQKHQRININETCKGVVKITSSYCKGCKDNKPIYAFYLQDGNTTLSPFGLCKECYIKKQREYYNVNKQKCLEYAAAYKKKNKERIKIKQHEYYCKKVGYVTPIRKKTPTDNHTINYKKKIYNAKQKQNITDCYIKSLLRRKGPITQQMIEDRRQQILLERSKIEYKCQ